MHRWELLAVDEQVRSLAAEHHPGRSPRIRWFGVSVVVEADVAQDQRELVRDTDAVSRILHEKRAVQAETDLRGGHHVRVIPVQTRRRVRRSRR